jgi:hypothetical protein
MQPEALFLNVWLVEIIGIQANNNLSVVEGEN